MRVSQIAKLLDTRFNKERGERKGNKKNLEDISKL